MATPEGIRHRVVTPPPRLLDSDEQAAMVADFRRDADRGAGCFRVAFCLISTALFVILGYAAAAESPFASLRLVDDAPTTFRGAVGASTPARVRRFVDFSQAALVAVATLRAARFHPTTAFRAGARDRPWPRRYAFFLCSAVIAVGSLLYAWRLAADHAASLPPDAAALAAFSPVEGLFHLWPVAYHAVGDYAVATMLDVEAGIATLASSQYKFKTV